MRFFKRESSGDAPTEALDAQEESLLSHFEGIAVYVGRVTTVGVRTMHFVTDDPDAVRAALDTWAEPLPDGLLDGRLPRSFKRAFERDMAWSFQRQLGVG